MKRIEIHDPFVARQIEGMIHKELSLLNARLQDGNFKAKHQEKNLLRLLKEVEQQKEELKCNP